MPKFIFVTPIATDLEGKTIMLVGMDEQWRYGSALVWALGRSGLETWPGTSCCAFWHPTQGCINGYRQRT